MLDFDFRGWNILNDIKEIIINRNHMKQKFKALINDVLLLFNWKFRKWETNLITNTPEL